MHETNLDHLLQVTTTRSNWGSAGLLHGRDEQPAFDDHLLQASTPPAPTEPVRSSDTQTSGSSPPASRRPPQDEADPSWSDESDAAAVPADNSTSIDTTTPHVIDDTAQVDASTADAAENGSTGQAGNGRDDDTQADKADETHESEAATVLDGSAAVPVALTNLPAELTTNGNDEVPASNGNESAETAAKENSPTKLRQPGDGSQPIKPVGDPETFNGVLQAEALPTQAEADHATPNGQATATTRRQTGITHQTVEAAGTARPKRQRPSVGEATSKGDSAAHADREESSTTVAPSQFNHATDKPQQTTEESPDHASTRAAVGRPRSRSDVPSSNGKMAVAAAVNSAQVEPAHETTKTDAADEPARPAAPHGPRTDALLHPFVKMQRSGTGVARSHRSSEREELPRVDATRFVSRVAKAFHAAQERGGTLQLRLSPPELGAVRLELMVKDGTLTATLETETPAARRVLLDHLPALRDRLAEQNIRIERFDVDVRHENDGQSTSNPHQHRHQHPQQRTPYQNPSRQPTPATESAPITTATTGLTDNSQINLVA